MRDDNREITLRDLKAAKANREQALRDGRKADANYWADTVVLIWRSMKLNKWL